MTSRTVATALLLLVTILVHPSSAIAQWVGDISNNTVFGLPFGQLATSDTIHGNTEINVVCFEENSVWLYLDHKIINNISTPNIVVVVDQLPPIDSAFRRIGENYTITNQDTGFWKLIAQMAAGAEIKVEVDGIHYNYTLKGFNKVYLDTCGWVKTANTYEAYLTLYK